MRKGIHSNQNFEYKIIGVDDEEGILDSLGVFLNKSGYGFVGVTDPLEAIERVKNEHFDLMLLVILLFQCRLFLILQSPQRRLYKMDHLKK